MIKYHKENIVIIGLGITGISCVNYFLNKGVIPRIMDTRLSPPCLEQLPIGIPYHLGSINKKWLINATLIIKSPGISFSKLNLDEITRAKVIGDVELFVREVSAPIIAITGSNGKTTVTNMLKEIAISAGLKVGVGGNIGFPVLSLLDSYYQIYILELSSFQLETTFNLKPLASTILNISEDHMDHYPLGLRQYQYVKLKIYNNAKICVFNADDKLTVPIIKNKNTKYISFGTNNANYHIGKYYGKKYLMLNNEPILSCAEMIISGLHNYVNALAALSLSKTINIPIEIGLMTLKKFRGLSHRFELIYEKNDIRWINDSKSTNVNSTKAALLGLNVVGTLHLLLGGDRKSSDLSSLLPLLQKIKVKVYCFGKDSDYLFSIFPKISIKTSTLEQAMRIISTQVKRGDLVLLSPACSSLDQFCNFEDRGNLFSKLAKEIGNNVIYNKKNYE